MFFLLITGLNAIKYPLIIVAFKVDLYNSFQSTHLTFLNTLDVTCDLSGVRMYSPRTPRAT